MALKKKLIAGLTSASLLAGGGVALDQNCVFDDVTLKVRNEKECFTNAEYEEFKKPLASYVEKDGALSIFGEKGDEIMAVYSYETKKRKVAFKGEINPEYLK